VSLSSRPTGVTTALRGVQQGRRRSCAPRGRHGSSRPLSACRAGGRAARGRSRFRSKLYGHPRSGDEPTGHGSRADSTVKFDTTLPQDDALGVECARRHPKRERHPVQRHRRLLFRQGSLANRGFRGPAAGTPLPAKARPTARAEEAPDRGRWTISASSSRTQTRSWNRTASCNCARDTGFRWPRSSRQRSCCSQRRPAEGVKWCCWYS